MPVGPWARRPNPGPNAGPPGGPTASAIDPVPAAVPTAEPERDRLGPGPDPECGEDPVDVVLHRLLGEKALDGDLTVRQAARDQLHDLRLPLTQTQLRRRGGRSRRRVRGQ